MGNINAHKVDLKKMLDLLSEKTGQRLDPTGLKEMADELRLSEKYLYEKIFLELDKRDSDTIPLREPKLNTITKYLGIGSYRDFEEFVIYKPDLQLESLVGNYYCYVRKNSKEESAVFKSPVQITMKKKETWFQLKGPSATFSGKIINEGSCLFIKMSSVSGKNFYHVYKIGNSKSPKLMQGVFSGVSTSFEPIGGRTVIVRVDEVWNEMVPRELTTAKMIKSKNVVEQKIGTYFSRYENNNVVPNRSYAFNETDLVP